MQNSTNSTSGNLPWWALMIIILLGIVALIFGCWGFLSALKTTAKQKTVSHGWTKHFKHKKIFKNIPINEECDGIYALTFKGINYDDFFRPVYVFKTNNLKQTSQELIEKIVNEPDHQIYKYMHNSNLTINNVVFYELDKEAGDEKLNFWIIVLETDKRGFNI